VINNGEHLYVTGIPINDINDEQAALDRQYEQD